MTETHRQIGFSLLLAGVVVTAAYAMLAVAYPGICYLSGNIVRSDVAETFYFVAMGTVLYGLVRLLREQPVPVALAFGPLRFDRVTAIFVFAAVVLQIIETGVLFSGLFITAEELTSSQREASAFGALNAIVLAPVFEELVFRGFLYTRIERFAGFIPALVWSSLAFALFHIEHGIGYVIAMIPGGFFLGYARSKSGNVALSMALHAGMNTSIVLGGLLLFGWR